MKKYLFIGEKPSLTKDVRACYMNHKAEIQEKVGAIDFVALSGHVCANYEPNDYDDWADKKWNEVDYPMVPDHWAIKPINDTRKKATIKLIKDKVNDYDGIIVGTDSDVEGYGIYYLLEHYLKIEKKYALRFVEHSLTDAEILHSLLTMTDYHTDPVHVRFTQSFLLRNRADWLYGMNATRIGSMKQNALMKIGRVKCPTIKLVYDNSLAIDNFKPRTYYILSADYGDFSSILQNENGGDAEFNSEKDIPEYPLDGVIAKKEVKRKSEHAPLLYDLSAIQMEAGSQLGLKPDETLEVIQSLYEKHKVISYPRTQCRYVSHEKALEFNSMLSKMSVFEDLAPLAAKITPEVIKNVMNDKKVVNDAEVQKESHDALLPTSVTPNLSAMTEMEKKVCHMIYKRLLAQFLPRHVSDQTLLLIKHGEGTFKANGRTVIEQGWKVLYKTAKDNVIPELSEGDHITADEMKPVSRTTTPPKRLTQASLVAAMENIANLIEDKVLKKSLADSKGIGTPATRASIIKDIIKTGYVAEKKNALYITDLGKAYVRSLAGIDMLSPVFAARLDTKIKQIQRGEADYDDVYDDTIRNLYQMCAQMEGMKQAVKTEEHTDETCPKCGGAIVGTKYYWSCSSCDFKIPKIVCQHHIDQALLKNLFAGKISPFYTFTKKDGTKFKGRLKMKDDSLVFDFSSGIKCPKCKKNDVVINNGGAFCDCGLKVFRKIAGYTLSDAELKKLVTKRKVTGINGFLSKKGTSFGADLILNDDFDTEFSFPEK